MYHAVIYLYLQNRRTHMYWLWFIWSLFENPMQGLHGFFLSHTGDRVTAPTLCAGWQPLRRLLGPQCLGRDWFPRTCWPCFPDLSLMFQVVVHTHVVFSYTKCTGHVQAILKQNIKAFPRTTGTDAYGWMKSYRKWVSSGNTQTLIAEKTGTTMEAHFPLDVMQNKSTYERGPFLLSSEIPLSKE